MDIGSTCYCFPSLQSQKCSEYFHELCELCDFPELLILPLKDYHKSLAVPNGCLGILVYEGNKAITTTDWVNALFSQQVVWADYGQSC